VCNNQVFNITETENRLRSELELSGNDTLIAAKNILQGEESLVENMQRQYLDLTNITKNIIDEYKKTVVDDFFALSEEITRIREIRLKADQFIELYGKLELPTPIDPVFLLNHTIHVKSELEKHTLFTPGKYGIQYNAELQNTKLELNTSLPEIQQFDGIWKKHAIENITTISEKIQAINTKLDKLSGELGSTESLLKDLTILKTSLGNQMIQNHIDAKTNKKFELTSKLEGLTIVERQYKLFESSVKSTINSELNSKLDLYRKTIGGIFKFLNPHIYMTDLVLDFDPTAGNKGRLYLSVKDDDGNELNPTFTFSAAQNNVLALSIFLSFALKQTWSRLDSIFLDDPIQNMDDINVHAFVDIIRSTIRNKPEKQFFISTHDERVFNFMKNKFGQEKVQVFVFESYGRVKQVGTN
jgi:DNA repair exonuclease SbcCD ATPase subunit